MFTQYLSALEAKANEAIKTEEGDYIDEETGLLFCGRCRTAKQCKVTAFDKTFYPKCLCKCESEREAERREAIERRDLMERVKRYRKMGFPESQMQHWTFENDDQSRPKLTQMAKRYVDNFDTFYKEGKGLLLHGDVGTGKTYIACMIANALIDQGHPVLVTHFARVLNTLQSTFEKQEYLDSLNQYNLLVIDDLGVERDTGFAKEQVFSIIDSRSRAGKPMIITTNLSMQRLVTESDLSDKRVYDRIIERCFPVEVSGESRRVKKLINTREEMKDLLGL